MEKELSFIDLACAGLRKAGELNVDAIHNAVRGLALYEDYSEQRLARARLITARMEGALIESGIKGKRTAEQDKKAREAADKWLIRMLKKHEPKFKWLESESAEATKKRIARSGKKVAGALKTGTKAKSAAVVASAPVAYHADVWNKELMVRIGEIAEPLKATILKPSQIAAFDRATVAYAMALQEIAKSK